MGDKMTTDIERQFFETFEIEKRQVDCEQPVRLSCEDCKTCKYSVYEYPQITDRILLELICIYCAEMNCWTNYTITFEKLREEILKDFIIDAECFSKQQVQALFKESR